jgi:tetratricopeptide (TPR) repeat protein
MRTLLGLLIGISLLGTSAQARHHIPAPWDAEKDREKKWTTAKHACDNYEYIDDQTIDFLNVALLACNKVLIEEDTEDSAAYNNRADILYLEKRFAEAIVDYTNAMSVNNEKESDKYDGSDEGIHSYVGRGQVYRTIGEYDQAIADYTAANEISKRRAINEHSIDYIWGNSAYIEPRAKLYLGKGDTKHAIEDYSALLEHNPSYDGYKDALLALGVKIIKSPTGFGWEVYKEPQFVK